MRIVKAETILLSLPFQLDGTPPWSWGGVPPNQFDTLLVRLETEDGLVGWGEAFSRSEDRALKALIDTRVLPLVVGRDARQISAIKHDLEFNLHNFGRVGSIMYGISAVDIALWDLLGKRAGQPLAELLGGACAERLPVYASLLRYGSSQEVERVVAQTIERGYRYIKLHEIDPVIIRAACNAAQGKAQVMLDTNCPWTVPQALNICERLADLELLWFEEPVWPPENYAGLAAIRQRGLQRIAAGENAGSLYDFKAMIDLGAIDIAQPDVAKTGGVTELLKIRSLCEASAVEFVPHCALFGPGQVATLHLQAATRTLPVFERLYCDFDVELYGPAMTPVDGYLTVPTGPGLGLDPLPEVLEKFEVR
ncbi:mandelate racemase/muconate lactonizing enzyme family protein [Pseudomonas sp.]|uniref:mandelate racemase/muconate lactonizing enzyme family protein n=1 Tax=Pseudomonas sp. TaxID=306 RepID=UPI00263015E7|nr:mandelate racemase/muconate lactonizing enzyme family protein [Pseudomonas sp.]